MDQLELFPDDIVNKKTNNQSRLPAHLYEYVAFCGLQTFRTTNTLNAGYNTSNCTEIATTYTMCYGLVLLLYFSFQITI